MNDTSKFNLQSLLSSAKDGLEVFQRYSWLIFIVFVVGLYGTVMLRIQQLSHQQPSSDAVSSQVTAAQTPHIDQSVVKQLQSLQDNSVSVQALFDEARSNPFQQ